MPDDLNRLIGQLNACFNHREFYWGHKIEMPTSSSGTVALATAI